MHVWLWLYMTVWVDECATAWVCECMGVCMLVWMCASMYLSVLPHVQHEAHVEHKLCNEHEVHVEHKAYVEYKVNVVALLGNVEIAFFLWLTFPPTRAVVLQIHGQHNNFLIKDYLLINLTNVLPKCVMKFAGKRNVVVFLGNTAPVVINVAWYMLMSYVDRGCFRLEFQTYMDNSDTAT